MTQPIGDALVDGQWHEKTVTLVNDESQWSFMGYLKGGMPRRIEIDEITIAVPSRG